LIGRYLFLSLPLKEGLDDDDDYDDDIVNNVGNLLGEKDNNIVDDDNDSDQEGNNDYSVPSMTTIHDQLKELQIQSKSQGAQITDLNTRVNTLLT